MKKYIFLLAVAVLLAAPIKAIGSAPNQETFNLVPHPHDTVIPDACGKFTYGTARPTFCYVLCANGLQPNQDYTLIYCPEGAQGGIICLGTATTDDCGRLRLQVQYTDELNVGDLPKEDDGNYPGARIILVVSAHVDCAAQTIAYDPSEYLFVEELITYDDTVDKITLSTWKVGAEGLLKFNPDEDTFDFCFCASGLVPLQEYTLGIYDTDQMCLGSRKAYKNGNIKITGSVDTGDLEDYEVILVLSDDVDCGPPPVMLDWNPDEYLFGDELFSFNDTDSP